MIRSQPSSPTATAVAWPVALRDTLAVVLPLIVGQMTGHFHAALGIAAGALAVMTSDSAQPWRQRARHMLLTIAAVGAASFIGYLAGPHSALLTAMSALWGLCAGMAVILGPDAARSGMASTIMLVVASAPPARPLAAAVDATLLIAAGGLLQLTMSVCLWPGCRRCLERMVPAVRRRDRLDAAVSADTPKASAMPWTAAMGYGIRYGIGQALAIFIGSYFALPHGYWIPMTVAIVLKPDAAATWSYSLRRIAGTGAGLLLATVLLHGVLSSVGASIAMFALFCLLYRRWIIARYGAAVAALTALVVILLFFYGVMPEQTIHDRALGTLIGAALALGLSWPVLLPAWKR